MNGANLAALTFSGEGDDSFMAFLIVGVVFFLTGLIWWRSHRDRRRREDRGKDDLPPTAGLAARRAADKVLSDLLDIGRDLTAQVDTKIRQLNRLVKEADDRIAQLKELERAARETPHVDAEPSRPVPSPAPTEEASSRAAASAPTSVPADAVPPPVFAIPPTSSLRPPSGETAAVPDEVARSGRRRRGMGSGVMPGLSLQAVALHEAGKSRAEIQVLTGLSAMEVDLALSMAGKTGK